MQDSFPVRQRVFRFVSLLAWSVAVLVLLGLGTWQLRRLSWKEDLLSTIAQHRMMAPVSISEIEDMLRTGEAIDYRPVRVSGIFDHAHERHFFATWQGASGFYVYTPLVLSDQRRVMINRGFVPYDQKEPQTRPQGQREGEQSITGLARGKLTRKPSFLVPENDLAKNIFYWKDLDAMAASTGIAADQIVPFFIDADATFNPGGLPVGGVTDVDLPNNHLQYAVTWYGLALTLIVIGILKWKTKRALS